MAELQSTVTTSDVSPPLRAATVPTPLVKRKRKGIRLFRIGEEIPKAAYFIIAALSFLIPIAAWCYFSYSGKEPAFILPTPTAVYQAFLKEIDMGLLWPDTKISVYRIGMGFLASAVLAIPLGILIGAYKTAEAAHEPFVGFVRYIPVPALIPLIMVIAGIGEEAKILLIFIGTYFQMVLMVADVTRQVPKDLLKAASTLGASRAQLLFRVLIPATMPGMLDVCRTMIGWAWTYLVVAEVVATDSGIGYSIMKAQRFMRTDEIWVGILVLGVLGLATDMLFKILQPRLLPWAELNKN